MAIEEDHGSTLNGHEQGVEPTTEENEAQTGSVKRTQIPRI